tara:strand:+ start:225 stop:611 length:387 start_codon:yes stop_codon:yes gene_type:complete
MGIEIQAIDDDGEDLGTAPSVDVTSVSTQRYFPRKVEHTLMSGNMITYTPHHKVSLTIDLEYLSKADYEYIMTYISNRFKITSEESENHPIDGAITYLYSGDTLDFSYSNQFKGAGFTGTLTFIETYT